MDLANNLTKVTLSVPVYDEQNRPKPLPLEQKKEETKGWTVVTNVVELEIVRPSREVKVRMQRNVVNLEIEPTKFTNIKRSGHMYITEESKD